MGPVTEDDAKDGLFFLDAFLEAVYTVPERHRERQAARAEKEADNEDQASSSAP